MATKSNLLAIFVYMLLIKGTLEATVCGSGTYIPTSCTGSYTEKHPAISSIWQIDIDVPNRIITWFNVNDPSNKPMSSHFDSSDFSTLYHIVMVSSSGSFTINRDISFLKSTKYNPSYVTFPNSQTATVISTTRIVGENIPTTSVTSYQLTFETVHSWICFGVITISDVSTFNTDGGDYQTDCWGPCADTGSGSMWPSGGGIAFVCPCQLCDSRCSECLDSTNTQCCACTSGNYLQPSSTTCLNTCPVGYWPDSGSNICSVCDTSCSACTGSSNTQCSACASGYYLQPSPSSTTCLNSCPTGTWEYNTNNICCDVSCSACTGSSNTQCSACNSGYYLQPSANSTACLNNCPDGYWPNSTICSPCYTSCSICTSPLSNHCSACKSGYYLQPSPHSTTCLSTCPTGTWEDGTHNTCTNCDVSCSACTGSSNNECSACKSGYYLQPSPSSTTCLNTCPDGYWPNSGSKICSICDTSCSLCTGSNNTQCSACKSGYYLQPSPSSTTCLNSCPTGYWRNVANSICSPCNPSCSSCTGSTNNQCSSCNSGYFLQPSSTICSSSCPAQFYYPNTSLNSCKSCASNCLTCKGPALSDCESSLPNHYSSGYTNAVSQLNLQTIQQIQTAASAMSVVAKAQSVTTSVLPIFLSTAGSVAAMLLEFIGDINLFQYINVPFPPNFVTFMQLFNSNLFPNILAYTYDPSELVNSTNGKFAEYGTSRVFLDNCGSQLDKELFALAIILVTSILAFLTKSCAGIHSIICKIRNRFRWNTLLAFYIGDFQEVFVYTLLQIRESINPIVSLCFGIVMVFSYLLGYLYLMVALNRKKKAREEEAKRRRRESERRRESSITQSLDAKADEDEEIGDIPESMSMVLEEFERKRWYTRNFILIMCLQNAIIGVMLVFLQNWGVYQAGIYTYIALVYGIIVLGAFRPFKKKPQVIIFLITQIVKGSMGLLAVILGLDGILINLSDNQINILGIVLISLACVGIISSLLLTVGMIIKSALDYFLRRAEPAKKKKLSPPSNHQESNIHRGVQNGSRSNIVNGSRSNIVNGSRSNILNDSTLINLETQAIAKDQHDRDRIAQHSNNIPKRIQINQNKSNRQKQALEANDLERMRVRINKKYRQAPGQTYNFQLDSLMKT